MDDTIKLELELSRRGALALRFVLDAVGGDPDGPRGVIETIKREMDKALNIEPGDWAYWNYRAKNQPFYGSVYIRDDWPEERAPDCKARIVK